MVKDEIKINGFSYTRNHPLKMKIRKMIKTLESGLEFEDKDDMLGAMNSTIDELKEVIK